MPGGFDFLVVSSFLFNITVEFFKTELKLIVIQKCMGNGNMTVGSNNSAWVPTTWPRPSKAFLDGVYLGILVMVMCKCLRVEN